MVCLAYCFVNQCDKPLSACPGQVSSCAGESRSPWQRAHRASNVEPETLNTYTFSDFTLRYFELIRRRLLFVGQSKGEMAHRRKKSGEVRINFGQVDLSRSLGSYESCHVTQYLIFLTARLCARRLSQTTSDGCYAPWEWYPVRRLPLTASGIAIQSCWTAGCSAGSTGIWRRLSSTN